ncbi:MAG: enoyl-CoA hydratase/isomerase family protein [Alphaproteobacteria bacterium]|nr:enoyl-CoA hydratase/isomerase family protein [Alphaproteobacteria bacterium]
MSEKPLNDNDEIIIRIEGRAGRITLNRPKALNALTYDQVIAMSEALERWRQDERVHLVILDGAGDRALCAGGDVLSFYERRDDGGAYAKRFWRDEYVLNAKISRYPKPFVALQDGIVMGGGIGISAHASHRIVTERAMLAMPETTIGLVPDVGGMWLLANAPGHFGEYLGLLGERMNAADAIIFGFSDTFVPSDTLPDLISALVDPGGDSVGVTVAHFAAAPPPPALNERREEIDRVFAAETVEAILAGLAEAAGGDDAAWQAKAVAAAESRSPLALKLTLQAIRKARQMSSLEQALNLEYRLTTRLFLSGEFVEGVRALLVDKDKAPKWNPTSLSKVSDALVGEFLSPLPEGEELGLAPA